jgi:hypothetical protein
MREENQEIISGFERPEMAWKSLKMKKC